MRERVVGEGLDEEIVFVDSAELDAEVGSVDSQGLCGGDGHAVPSDDDSQAEQMPRIGYALRAEPERTQRNVPQLCEDERLKKQNVSLEDAVVYVFPDVVRGDVAAVVYEVGCDEKDFVREEVLELLNSRNTVWAGGVWAEDDAHFFLATSPPRQQRQNATAASSMERVL